MNITAHEAKRLAGKLPRPGYAELVVRDGRHYWLQHDRIGWWLNGPTAWRRRGAVYVLGEEGVREEESRRWANGKTAARSGA